MKQLRILTGAHSGAQIPLAPGDYRLGPDDQADVCITDWTEQGIRVSLDETGVIRWTFEGDHASQHVDTMQAGTDADAAAPATAAVESTVTLVPDLVPVPFGDVVLCFGPDNAPWPADVDLLRMLWIKPEAQQVRAATGTQSQRAIGVALAGGMIAALLVAGATLFGARPRDAQATTNPEALAVRVGAALRTAGLNDLQAQPRGSAIVVEGMVGTAAEDVAARGIFSRLAPDQSRILRQYDVGEDDRRNLEDALGVAGVHVKYRGAGVFEVDGTVQSMTQFQAALARVKSDLDTNIQRVDVAVHEAPAPMASAGDYSALIAIGDVRYVETPDGVKHLYPAGPASSHRDMPSRQP
ncbi:type III secretion system protein [Trinickia fusca]|nr:type III secretion system protein [Trinickia fusca]